MKTKIIPPEPAETIVQIEMTQSEARLLRALVGDIALGPNGESHNLIWNLYQVLDKAAPFDTLPKFHYHFEGSLKCVARDK